MRLATDIGGTFTDLVYVNEATGEVGLAKAPSTPPAFGQGILDAIGHAGLDLGSVQHFVHGCTVVINALTEQRGARTALVTTRGFRDVLAIGRANRPDIYNMRFRKQPPFVPREHRFEVTERMDYKGGEVTPLETAEVRAVAEQIRAEGLEAVGICFLHSYANPAHERACAQLLREMLPGVFVSTSHEITQEWREYERTSTVVLNAFVQPVTASYLEDLEGALRRRGAACGLNVMKSNGGTHTFELAKSQPIHLVESGPVGGVIGARAVGAAIGLGNLITIDVGGTTAKTSLIDRGVVKFTTDYRIERDAFRAGYPIKVPVVDIVEIGAGGGSIAWLDPAGALKIGPRSAGAVPGPACYGKGGTEPTVTDANLVLGRINPDYFLGGEMTVDLELARAALSGLAEHFAVSVEEAALGVVRLADANMVNAIKLVSVRRGYDPRDFALMAFGGGGSMHACALARELQIGTVVVPAAPGHFSAWGMLLTEPRQDFIRTRIMPCRDESMDEASRIYEAMEAEGRAFLASAGYPTSNLRFERMADMRYQGQEHTVRVPVAALTAQAMADGFHGLHERAYTFRLDSAVEFVNFQVTAVVPQEAVDLGRLAPAASAPAAPKGRRRVYFGAEGWVETAIYERDGMAADQAIAGPCIVEEPAASTVVPPGMRVRREPLGNLLVETGG